MAGMLDELGGLDQVSSMLAQYGIPQTGLPSPAPAAPAPSNPIIAGLKAGAYGAVGDIGRLGQAVGSLAGHPELGQGLAEWGRNNAAASGRPDLDQQSWFGNGVGGFLSKAAYEGAKMTPILAASAFSGGAVGEGSLALRLAATAAPMFPGAVAGQVESAQQQPGGMTGGDAARSLALGVPLAALESVVPGHLAGGMLERGATEKLLPYVTKEAITNAGAGLAGGGAQAAADVAFRDDMSPQEKMTTIRDSAIQAGVFSGIVGGSFGAVRGALKPVNPGSSDAQLADSVDQALAARQGPPAPPAPWPRMEPSGPENNLPVTPQPAAPPSAASQVDVVNAPPRAAEPADTSGTGYLGPRTRIGFAPDVTISEANLNDLQPPPNSGALVPAGNSPAPAVQAGREVAPAGPAVDQSPERPVLAPAQAATERFRQYIPDSQATSWPEFYNEVEDRLNTGQGLSPKVQEAAAKLGLIDATGKPVDIDALIMQREQEGASPKILGALQVIKQLRDAAGALRSPDDTITPERTPDPAQILPPAKAIAAPLPPEAGPIPLADQVRQVAQQLAGPENRPVSIDEIHASLPDVHPSDLDNAMQEIHNDDSDSTLVHARDVLSRQEKIGNRAKIRIPGQGAFHFLQMEEPEDAVQEPSAAGVDAREPPGNGAAVGSGDTQGYDPAAARDHQIQAQAPAPDEGTGSADLRQGLQEGTLNPVRTPDQVRAEAQTILDGTAPPPVAEQRAMNNTGLTPTREGALFDVLGGGQVRVQATDDPRVVRVSGLPDNFSPQQADALLKSMREQYPDSVLGVRGLKVDDFGQVTTRPMDGMPFPDRVSGATPEDAEAYERAQLDEALQPLAPKTIPVTPEDVNTGLTDLINHWEAMPPAKIPRAVFDALQDHALGDLSAEDTYKVLSNARNDAAPSLLTRLAKQLGDVAQQFGESDSGSLDINRIGQLWRRKMRSSDPNTEAATAPITAPTDGYRVPQQMDRTEQVGGFVNSIADWMKNLPGPLNLGKTANILTRGPGLERDMVRTGLAFRDISGLEQAYSTRLPEIADWKLGTQLKREATTRFSQLATQTIKAFNDTVSTLSYAPEVMRMMGMMTEHGVFPDRPMSAQDWHDTRAPDYVAKVAAWDAMQPTWQKLGQTPNNIGQEAIRQMTQLGRSERYAQNAVALNTVTRMLFPEVPLPPAPLDAFLNATDAHTNLTASENFWKRQLAETRSAVNAFLANGREASTRLNGDAGTGMFNDHYKDLIDFADDVRGRTVKTEQGPYFHLGRQGDFFVSFHLPKDVNGDVDGAALQKAQAILEKNGFGGIGLDPLNSNAHVMVRVANREAYNQLYEVVNEDLRKAEVLDTAEKPRKGLVTQDQGLMMQAHPILQRIISQMEGSKNWDTTGLAGDAAQSITAAKFEALGTLRGMLHDLLPDSSLLKADLTRMGVQGYSKDFAANTAARSQQTASSLGYMMTMAQRNGALDRMHQRVNDAKSSDTIPSNVAVDLQDVANEVQRRASQTESRAPDTLLNTLASKLMGVTHSAMIGFSPAYHMLQMSQIATRLWPELVRQQGVGPVRAMNAMVRNTGTAYNVLLQAYKNGGEITPDVLKAAGIGDAKAKAVMQMVNEGHINTSTFSQQLQGQLNNTTGGLASKTQHMANATAAWSEATPRLIAALSAYDLHPRYEASGGKLAPADYMRQTVSRSMYDWGDETQIPFYRALGPVGKLAGQFHQYQVKSLNQFYNMAQAAFTGGNDISRTEAARWLGMHSAAVLALSGTLGLPMAGWMAAAATKASGLFNGGESYDVEAHFRNWLAEMFGKTAGEMIAHGVPMVALGTDTKKYGDADLAPFSRLLEDRRKMEDAIPDYLANSAGAVPNMAMNVALGMRDMSNGRVLQGAAKFLPTGMRNLIGAYRLGSEGAWENPQGEKMPMDPSATDILKTALGFKPEQLSEAQEKRGAVIGAQEEARFRAQTIRQNLAMAIEHNDPERQQQWFQAATQFDSDPNHLSARILPGFAGYFSARQRAQAYAKATGLPLGTPLTNIGAVNLTKF